MAKKTINILKSYFSEGNKPSAKEFADLIDSFMHKDFTALEIKKLANQLASIQASYIQYSAYNIGDSIVKLQVKQRDAEDQIIEITDSTYEQKKQYFLGNAPYTIQLKDLPIKNLEIGSYYYINYQLDQNYSIQKLFGHDLPAPEGYELGTLKSERFYFNISKRNFGSPLKVIHTSIKFINHTSIDIEYRASSSYWNDQYKNIDTTTSHYQTWDYLYFQYNADMTREKDRILCKVYNDDTNQLLFTGYLNPEQNLKNAWGGGQARAIRKIRIECNY